MTEQQDLKAIEDYIYSSMNHTDEWRKAEQAYQNILSARSRPAPAPATPRVVDVDEECHIYYSDGTMKLCEHVPRGSIYQECAPGYGSNRGCIKWDFRYSKTTPNILDSVDEFGDLFDKLKNYFRIDYEDSDCELYTLKGVCLVIDAFKKDYIESLLTEGGEQ